MLKVIDLKKFTKLNSHTYTAPNGNILQFTADYALPGHPLMFQVTTTNGNTLFTRCEIEAAKELKI